MSLAEGDNLLDQTDPFSRHPFPPSVTSEDAEHGAAGNEIGSRSVSGSIPPPSSVHFPNLLAKKKMLESNGSKLLF